MSLVSFNRSLFADKMHTLMGGANL